MQREYWIHGSKTLWARYVQYIRFAPPDKKAYISHRQKLSWLKGISDNPPRQLQREAIKTLIEKSDMDCNDLPYFLEAEVLYRRTKTEMLGAPCFFFEIEFPLVSMFQK